MKKKLMKTAKSSSETTTQKKDAQLDSSQEKDTTWILKSKMLSEKTITESLSFKTQRTTQNILSETKSTYAK